MDTNQAFELLKFAGQRYLASGLRALLILGGLYLIFWTFKRPWMEKYRVPTVGNAKANPAKEALLTYTTYLVFTLASVGVVIAGKVGHSMMYTEVSDYGWAYTIASFFIFCFWSDTTFYWSHYWMHKSRLLYKTHVVHHQFVNTTPWAAYAFDVGEAFINAGSFFLLMMILPWHPIVLFVYVIFSVSYNGMIHLGYDFFPKSWAKHPVLKWLNTTTHHIYHHQKLNCNYSFMFTFWDKIMKTEKLPETRS